jgi:glycosyltransferase involved in cell wall biosynthesis
VKLSVVICTRDRARSLAAALTSLTRAAAPIAATWELIVVDNGSRDTTAAVIAAFRDRLPIRAALEREPGLARARNTGVAAATGDWIVWTDDDVTVSPGWLRAYESAFERHPEAAFFGGPIAPRLDGDPPAWLARTAHLVRSAYAGLDLGSEEMILRGTPGMLPYGANLAIRGREQRRFRFDPGLGRAPGRVTLGGDETDVLRRIVAAGGTGVWVPAAAVEHRIGPERQTAAYLRAYYRSAGAGHARRRAERGVTTSTRTMLTTALRIAGYEALVLVGRATRRHRVRVVALRRASYLRGGLLAQRDRRVAVARAAPAI